MWTQSRHVVSNVISIMSASAVWEQTGQLL